MARRGNLTAVGTPGQALDQRKRAAEARTGLTLVVPEPEPGIGLGDGQTMAVGTPGQGCRGSTLSVQDQSGAPSAVQIRTAWSKPATAS